MGLLRKYYRPASFLLGGGLIAVVGILLLHWQIEYLRLSENWANFNQLVVTLLLNFAYNQWVTWRNVSNNALARRLWMFGLTRVISMGLSLVLFAALTSGLIGMHYQAANAVCLVVAAIFNYKTSDKLVFTADANGQEESSQMRRWNPLRLLWKGVRRQLTLFVLVIIGTGVAMSFIYNDARDVVLFFTALTAVIFTVASCMEASWRLYGRRDPEALQAMKYPAPKKHHEPLSVDVIVCAVNEPDVIYDTIRDLAHQDHSDVRVIVSLIESDDSMKEKPGVFEGNEETIATAYRAAEDYPDRVVVLVLPYEEKMKPYQLNEALKLCNGDIVGVIDAEDATHPRLIRAVEAAFHENDVDIVQGAVQLMNLGIDKWYRWREWFCVHDVLEYFFWWSSRVMFQVRNGFVPLGGNTVFIRRHLLERAGGWPITPTEDCALGVKLSTEFGAKVAAYYDPELATREETPDTARSLIKQRVRWNTGFGKELLEKKWWELPTFRQRALAWYTLATPFIQAVTGLFLLATIATVIWLKAPVMIAMLTYIPLIAVLQTMVIQVVGLYDFGRMYGVKVKVRHYIALLVGFYPYQLLLAWAAIRSVKKIVQGDMSWQHNTAHSNKHRTAAPHLTPVEEAV